MVPYWIPVVGIIGVIIWKISSLARRWIKFAIFTLVCFATSLLIPIWIFRPRDTRNPLIPSMYFRALGRLFGMEFSIEGQENIVRNSGSVVLINHQSILDLIVLSHLWPALPKCTVISKKEMLYYQPIGLSFWLCGVIFINRTKPSEAQSTVNKTGEIIRKRKARVLMFPEGTRNSSSKLLPFKKGAFHLAVASQCPIQPIAVSRFTFLENNKFERGKIKIRILPAIPTEGCTTGDVTRLSEETYKILSEHVDQISNPTNS
ncbi:unnamed protein product [Psylliodes chrysocephalus]|nr:unnamed protein product [Psylliodes chrysocephala]